MALEDAVVLGQSIAAVASVDEALDAFMKRRFERVKLGQPEQQQAPSSENHALLTRAFAMLGEPC